MDRRRPLVVIATLCVAATVVSAPSAAAQQPISEPRIEVSDLPVLSELPPLPDRGGAEGDTDDDGTSDSEWSGVQIAALGLAVGVLVSGGLGLALVTRRVRTEEPTTNAGE